MLLNKHPWQAAIEPLFPEFETLTGVKIIREVYPEDQFRQKVTVELTAGTGTLDVFMSMVAQEGLKFYRAGWYEVLDPYLANATLTLPEYDAKDFQKAAWDAEFVEGKLVGLPIQAETEIVYYRKDLFEQAGLKPPATLNDLEAAAKQFHKPPERFGIVMRGKRAAATSVFSSFLHNFGGDWMQNGKPAINSPEAVQAFRFYGDLLRLYGPPGSTNNHWYEASAIFAQGKAAMYVDFDSLFSVVLDPEKSQVKGKVGFAPFPAGPKANLPSVPVWGIALSRQSKNKEASWFFLQWATTKEQVLKVLLKGVPGARQSAWDHPEFKKADIPLDWVETHVQQMKIGSPNWNPPVVAVSEARDIIGQVIVTAIEGGDVKAAADKANAELEDLIRRTQ